jgi:maleylacetate reductase
MPKPDWIHTGYAQQIHFGGGAVGNLGRVVRDLGGRHVLLITTAGRLASPEGERIARALGTALASTFAEVRSHVPTSIVQQALMQARRDGVDAIVSFGGGSCADLGKAICFFTEQERGTPGVSFFDRPVLPHVSIPTTYSGAELTPFFGMTDEATKRKSGAGGPTIAPSAVIYDPEVTIGTPPDVSAQTGMNALAHCVEAAYSPVRTPEAEAVALGGAARIVDALPRVIADPLDLDARGAMLAGAVLGGRCLQNASMGVHHGLSQLLGGRTGIPHGLANAIVLAHALRFTAEAVPAEAERIAAAVGATDGDGPAAINRLRAALGLPGRLSEAGVDEAALDDVAAMAPDNRNVANNPRPVSSDDARAILAAAF